MNRIVRCLMMICLVVGGWPGVAVSAKDERGLTLNGVSVSDQHGQEVLLYQESHALVIGISNYTEWPTLPGVQRDVREVRDALEAHGFNVVVNMDLDGDGLEQALKAFINQYGHNPENRLLVYFAGHGHTLTLAYGGDMGYIVPVDAPLPRDDEEGFLAKAMDMQMIEVYARRIQSKHALFVFDSCFSGSIFALSRATPESITYKTGRPVRQFITSGSADEKVPDESIFRRQFIVALQGEGDTNGDGYVTGAELGSFLEDTVINYSKGAQHPQYGTIRDPNLDKGDFVFKLSITITVKATPKPEPPVDPETAMWKLIEGSENISDVQDFLAAYPDGTFAKVAQLKLKQLERQQLSPTPLPPVSEADQQIPQLLEQAEAYFDRQWYTTPEDTNAFEVYREVLKLDPHNEHALQRIQQMLDFYRSQAERSEQQGNTPKAIEYYHRYLKIAPNDDTIWDKIAALEAPPSPAPATPTPQPPSPATPTPRATATPAPVLTPTPRATATPGQEWHDPVSGIDFVWVPEGCFQMGQTEKEKRQIIEEIGEDKYKEYFRDELPRHQVCVEGFWMGKYEVTNAQYRKWKRGHDSQEFEGHSLNDDKQPAVYVSWEEAKAFTEWLTKQHEGKYMFRLPTEAEWEYAARAGTKTARFWGDNSDKACQYANVADEVLENDEPFQKWLKDQGYQWLYHKCNDGYAVNAPVGKFKPNAFGLYDMLGNVWEWNEDVWHDTYEGAPADGRAWEEGKNVDIRLLRGGSWYDLPRHVRCANRHRLRQGYRNDLIGFRVVRVAGAQ